MTVYEANANEIKIALSDGEVTAFFGGYEKIAAMKKEVLLTVGMLLSEELKKHRDISKSELSVEIRAVKRQGCVITLTSAENLRKAEKSYIFFFPDTEAMLCGITVLYSRGQLGLKSNLYKMENGYRLTVCAPPGSPRINNRFGTVRTASAVEIAFTEEYGKLICRGNAVGEIGKAFTKRL